MKKIIALILTAIMVFSFAACNGGKDEDPNLIKIGDYQAVYKGSGIVKDSDGNDTLVATYDYTNNSKEAQSFEWSIFYTLTQGGSELEYTTIFVSEDSYDTLDESTRQDVAPGESLEVKMTYKLNDLTTPVEIKFSDLLESETDSLTIDLTSLK